MQRRLFWHGCLLSVLLLAACGGPAASVNLVKPAENTQPTAPASAQRRVALIMKTLTNPFFAAMERGARQAETELGIELIVLTGSQETSVEQQISNVRRMIEEQVDAIVIAPADSANLVPVLKDAQAAGIVVVNIDNRLDPVVMQAQGLTGVPFISVDNEEGAYQSASFLASLAEGPSQAIILEGIRSAQNSEDRKQGAVRAFAEHPEVEIVAIETANWKIDEAQAVAAELFSAHPDVTLVFAANDMMAFGVIKLLRDRGRTDVRVASFDALDEALGAIRAGDLVATVDQQAGLQGYMGVKTAINVLNGKPVPPQTLVDVLLVTAENVDAP
jgi:ribose transport system substrate-binding protein